MLLKNIAKKNVPIGKTVRQGKVKDENIVVNSIVDFLNAFTSSNVKAESLMGMFNHYNVFYESPDDAFSVFYSNDHLFDKDVQRKYIEIANLHMQKNGESISAEGFSATIKKIAMNTKIFH